MTTIDLRTLPDEKTMRTYDVCIVGAGAAGLYLAHRLTMQGNRVVILEAGGDVCLSGSTIGIESGFLMDVYGGAVGGRAFGVGGTTSLWGGQLLPYSIHDKRKNTTYTEVWNHIIDLTQNHACTVYDTLDLGNDGQFFSLAQEYLGDRLAHLNNSGLAVLLSDWLPFRRRNLRYMLDRRTTAGGSLDIFTNAVVSSWSLKSQSEPLARVKSVYAQSINGRTLQVSAPKFIIAAGAIESTRILLELFSGPGKGLISPKRAIGRYLSDHLSAPIATVSPVDRRKVAFMFGPRFRNGRMRTFRFVETGVNERCPRGFFHFVFKQENPGFHLARKILGGLQARKIPELHIIELLNGMQGLASLAYTRYVNNRLFVSADTHMQLQFDIEQQPCYENYLSLSEERDDYGRLKANINWRVMQEDYENIENTSRRFINNWPYRELGMSALVSTNAVELGVKLYDTYHPVGTCRMGRDDEAVVNYDMQIYGLANAYLVSTGVFPSAGTANPTFSLLCLSEALAINLGKIDQ